MVTGLPECCLGVEDYEIAVQFCELFRDVYLSVFAIMVLWILCMLSNTCLGQKNMSGLNILSKNLSFLMVVLLDKA